jgi:hypothetical protein
MITLQKGSSGTENALHADGKPLLIINGDFGTSR